LACADCSEKNTKKDEKKEQKVEKKAEPNLDNSKSINVKWNSIYKLIDELGADDFLSTSKEQDSRLGNQKAKHVLNFFVGELKSLEEKLNKINERR